MSSQSFADLGVSNAVVRALSERGIEQPFAIQGLVTADVLAGRDVLARSPTGSGKTLAFGIPIVDSIEATDPRPSALILPGLKNPPPLTLCWLKCSPARILLARRTAFISAPPDEDSQCASLDAAVSRCSFCSRCRPPTRRRRPAAERVGSKLSRASASCT